MIENLQDELYQLENKQAKEAKLRANKSWRTKNAFFEVLKRQNMQNQTIFELYTDDNKSKYSSNPMNILKSAKKNMKLYTKLTSTAATTEFAWKIPNRKKISNEHFNICQAEISLDEIIKSVNSEIITPQVMMASKQNFVSTFEMNQLPSFKMFVTPGESLTPWVLLIEQESYLPYIKGNIKDIANYRPISLLNLDYKIYTTNS